jgi:hypothetical protein
LISQDGSTKTKNSFTQMAKRTHFPKCGAERIGTERWICLRRNIHSSKLNLLRRLEWSPHRSTQRLFFERATNMEWRTDLKPFLLDNLNFIAEQIEQA